MNFRTLGRSDSFHVINLVCLLLAWAISSFYFENVTTSSVITSICHLLVSPYVYLREAGLGFGFSLSTDPLVIFAILWFCYLVLFRHFSRYLMIKDHAASELRNWYLTRKMDS